MSGIRAKYDENYKKNVVALSYASEKTIKEVSDELGINTRPSNPDGKRNILQIKKGHSRCAIRRL